MEWEIIRFKVNAHPIHYPNCMTDLTILNSVFAAEISLLVHLLQQLYIHYSTMSDEPGRLKETVACCFVGQWRQYRGGLLRLEEARSLVISLRRSYLELKNGGLMGVAVGRGKKKQAAVDSVLEMIAEQMSQAEVLRYNIHFQLRALRSDMLDVRTTPYSH